MWSFRACNKVDTDPNDLEPVLNSPKLSCFTKIVNFAAIVLPVLCFLPIVIWMLQFTGLNILPERFGDLRATLYVAGTATVLGLVFMLLHLITPKDTLDDKLIALNTISDGAPTNSTQLDETAVSFAGLDTAGNRLGSREFVQIDLEDKSPT